METDLIKQPNDYMQQNCISQKQLADTLKISEPSVSRYLSGARMPNKKTKQKLFELGIYENKDEIIQKIKDINKQLIRQYIKHYSTKEKLDLIRIIAR